MDAAKGRMLADLQRQMDAIAAGEQAGSERRETARRGHGAARRKNACPPDEKRAAARDDARVSPEKHAWNRIVSLCSRNEYCRKKMADRLRREDLPESAIEAALDRAETCGLIDDVRWGEMRASGLMRKGMGTPGIERELRGYGIDPGRIHGWPQEYAERFGDELERARRVLDAKPPKSRNPRASAYARLIRKGYDSTIAAQASAAWETPRVW